MPSRGTPLTPLRLSAETLARIDAEVTRMNGRLRKKKWNRTEWIRQAIEERLDKLNRGRKKQPKEDAVKGDQGDDKQQAGEEVPEGLKDGIES